jgi:hypothetical protein
MPFLFPGTTKGMLITQKYIKVGILPTFIKIFLNPFRWENQATDKT